MDGAFDPQGIFAGGALDASFPGDFYRVQDDVTRGITMDAGDLSHMQEPSSKNGGDFYMEPDVIKGVSMGAVFDGHLDYMGKPEMFGMDAGLAATSLWGAGSMHANSAVFSLGFERFQESDKPPCAPDDTFFQFEATTLFAKSRSPADIGNSVLDFLASQVLSSITKVRRHKFAIKADIFVENRKCTLKVRVYSERGEQFAVEFQRRSGDSLAFQSIFCQAKKHIQSSFAVVCGGNSDLEASREQHDENSAVTESTAGSAGLQPLLEMAGCIDTPSLQAEAAVALANTAQDRSLARSLCSSEAFTEFLKLLQAESVDVLYPAARLLGSLSELPEAGKFFAEGGILPTMLLKVSCEDACSLVRLQLAEAFCAAVSRSADFLPLSTAEELSRGLVDAMQKTEDVPIRRNLQEAEFKLGGLGSPFGAVTPAGLCY